MTRRLFAPWACYAATLVVVIGSLAQAQSPTPVQVDPNSFLYTNGFGYFPVPNQNLGCGCCRGPAPYRPNGPMVQFEAAQALAMQRMYPQAKTPPQNRGRKIQMACGGKTFFVYER